MKESKDSNEKKFIGRPRNISEKEIASKIGQDKSQIISEYWTQHRRTLLSLQMQYIRNKKTDDSDQEVNTNKKNPKKKIDLEYQSGFLFAHKETSDISIQVTERAKNYQYLNKLFSNYSQNSSHIQDPQLRQFIKIMLELKHQCIVDEFFLIYDWMLKEISYLKYQMIEKQEDRTNWLDKALNTIINNIEKFALKAPYFNEYLKNDRIETERFLQATIYCFIAEKYNFNINQYYSQAFAISMNEKKKKIKADQSNNQSERQGEQYKKTKSHPSNKEDNLE